MTHALPFMNPRIEPVGYLGAAADTVDVSGPINWDPGASPAETAVWFSAVVSQVVNPGAALPIAMGIGASHAMNTPPPPPPGATPMWWLRAHIVAPGAAAFTEGGATVSAWATILCADGGSSSYHWSLPIMILPHDQRPPNWP
jgi:hypothetical protein